MSSSLASKDTYSCQPITNAPLIRAGLSSAAYIVTVAAILGQTRLIGGMKGSHTFGSKTQPHDKSDSKERLPRVCETGSDRGDDQDDGSDEDLSSSAEPVVERVGNCESADASVSSEELTPHASERSRDVGSRVDETNFPLVTVTTWLTVRGGDAKLSGEG